MTRLISAAGGVVFRTTSKGDIHVLLAHRPGYDDWSFPKGKADGDETPEETAVREVLEETGYHCRIVAQLTTTEHELNNGLKEVHWFAMRPLPDSPGFKKNSEVDAIKWLTRKKAREALDYKNDVTLLNDADLRNLSRTGTLKMIRHAEAGKRGNWDGEDQTRPLTKKGRRQADALAEHLAGAGIERVITSPYDRCLETVEPLAKKIGAKVEINKALTEGQNRAAVELTTSLAGPNVVLCTHGDVLSALYAGLTGSGLETQSEPEFAKGSIWVVEVEAGRYKSARYRPPPDV